MSDPEPVVVSPCIAICRIDSAKRWCEGCLRTLDEIAAWGSLSNAGKRAVLLDVEQRRLPQNASGVSD